MRQIGAFSHKAAAVQAGEHSPIVYKILLNYTIYLYLYTETYFVKYQIYAVQLLCVYILILRGGYLQGIPLFIIIILHRFARVCKYAIGAIIVFDCRGSGGREKIAPGSNQITASNREHERRSIDRAQGYSIAEIWHGQIQPDPVS